LCSAESLICQLQQNAREHEQSLRLNAGLNNATSSRTSPEVGQTVTPRDGNPLSDFLNNYEQESPANPAQEEIIDIANQQISESRRYEISDDRRYNYVITQNAPTQEEREFKQPRSSLPDTEDTSINLGIDFDSAEVFQRRLMREIFNDKRERRRQFQLMALEGQRLEQIKAVIEQKNNELKAREAKINEAEPLLPSVRQLQAAQINFSLIMQ
jgi:hypothetical protein